MRNAHSELTRHWFQRCPDKVILFKTPASGTSPWCSDGLNIHGMGMTMFQAALLLMISNYAVANNSTNGCKLMVPQAAQEKLEPDQEPLYIIVKIQHLDISDVPSSGGSFGVDVG